MTVRWDPSTPEALCPKHGRRACQRCYQRAVRAYRLAHDLCTTCGVKRSADFSRCQPCRKRELARLAARDGKPSGVRAFIACTFCKEVGHNRASCEKLHEHRRMEIRRKFAPA